MMDRTKASLVLGLAVMLVAAGCSSPAKRSAKAIAEAQEERAEQAEREAKRQQKIAKRELKAYPDWALATPKPDATGLYAVGVGRSQRLEIARKIAALEAGYAIAKQLGQEIAGGERLSQGDRDTISSSNYRQLIDQLVDWQSVVGTEVVKEQVEPVDGVFRAFVLVRYPYAEFNQVLQDRMRGIEDARLRREYEDLHERLRDMRRAKAEQEDISRQANEPPRSESVIGRVLAE